MQNNDFGKTFFSSIIFVSLSLAIFKLFDSLDIIAQGFLFLLSAISPVFFAFVIAFVLLPLCRRVERFLKRRKTSFFQKRARGLSVVCVYLFFAVLVGVFIYFILPVLAKGVGDLLGSLDAFLKQEGRNLGEIIKEFFVSYDPVGIFSSKAISASRQIARALISLVLSVYILTDRASVKKWAKFFLGCILPEKGFVTFRKYFFKATSFVYEYLYCTIVDALIIFALSFVILALIGVKYFAPLSFLIGAFNMIPYFGSISIGAVSVVITIASSGVKKAVILAVSLIVLQQIDSNFIGPRLVGGRLKVRPFWVLSFSVVLSGLFGVWALLVSAPALAFFKYVAGEQIAKARSLVRGGNPEKKA